jgi:hypothetical protein
MAEVQKMQEQFSALSQRASRDIHVARPGLDAHRSASS